MNRDARLITKVEELGLQDKVLEALKDKHFSSQAFSRDLKEAGINITAQSIRKFIRKSKQAQAKIAKQDIQTAHEISKLVIDYGNEIRAILDEVKEVKEQFKTDKDWQSYNQMVDKLYKGLELVAKLSGDLDTDKEKIDINIIYNEINTDIEKKMRDVKTSIFDAKIIDVEADILENSKSIQKSETNE